MVLNAEEQAGELLRLENETAKKLSRRAIPLKVDVREAPTAYLAQPSPAPIREGYILRSERGGHMKVQSIMNWFPRGLC